MLFTTHRLLAAPHVAVPILSTDICIQEGCAPAADIKSAVQCNKLPDGSVFSPVQALPCCHLCGHGHLGAAVCLNRRSQPGSAAEPWGCGSHLLRHVYIASICQMSGCQRPHNLGRVSLSNFLLLPEPFQAEGLPASNKEVKSAAWGSFLVCC